MPDYFQKTQIAVQINNILVTFFFIIKPTRCTNFTNLFWHETFTCFGQFLCPSSGVYSLYTQQWYIHTDLQVCRHSE